MNTIQTFDELVKDIEDRRDLKRLWASIEADVKDEIRVAWLSIIDQHRPTPTSGESLNASLTRMADALEKLLGAETAVKKAFSDDEIAMARADERQILELEGQVQDLRAALAETKDLLKVMVGEQSDPPIHCTSCGASICDHCSTRLLLAEDTIARLKRGHTTVIGVGEPSASHWTCTPAGCGADSIIRKLEEQLAAPIPMRLCCEGCGKLHIDEGDYAKKIHHATHACQFCGLTWRPAVQKTVGVQFLPGFKNEPEKG